MDHEVKALLKKYAEDQCTADELQVVQQLLKSGAFLEEWESVMQEDVAANPQLINTDFTPSFDRERVLKRIDRDINRKSSTFNSKWVMGIAASLLLCCFIGAYYLNTGRPSNKKEVFTAFSTRAGQQKVIMLSDGSRIVANHLTKVTYPETFNKNTREVYLQGEAFFDIKHEVTRPFIVHAGKLTVHVLGTSFNIKAYPKESSTTVSVATGKVGVTTSKMKAQFLLPNQQLQYHNKDGVFQNMQTTPDEILSWQKGTMIFKQEALGNITAILERRYNVSIQVNYPMLLEKQITGRFHNKTLTEVLDILSQTGGFTYNIDHNKVIVSK
jgi:transmembrane sensor